ncbi:hypothetical protein QSJ19_22880 [Gordonia sp. ABSL11-1]|uniref:hypothetical protein n=1 Tax=Gordonia sp. ABSL11-1 TaxID=3053924 RepID=UPI002573A484|nr:hypothetical protein [Gordonia sp. ABSL11-1]MDL9948370.1 hypothetical protein [Gordonia sp. ABSL11-1]
MTTEVFAGVPVSDLARAVDWFERLLGDVESFDPDDVERVWTVTDHGHIYDNGVRKAVFRDPDGNEIGIGGMVHQD